MTPDVLQPAIEGIASALLALLFALGSVAITRLLTWLRLSEDAKVREYLDEALRNAIAFAQAKVQARMPQAIPAETRGAVIAEATAYATAHVPDALKRFGVDSDGVRDLVAARLPRPANVGGGARQS